MRLESAGILIELRPFGERDCIARFFTREHGMLAGMLKGAALAKRRPLVGQCGAVSWNARLDSQLGAFHWEPDRNLIAPLMGDMAALGYAGAAFALLVALLPEREKNEKLFDKTIDLIMGLQSACSPRGPCMPPHWGGTKNTASLTVPPGGGARNACGGANCSASQLWVNPIAPEDFYLDWEICLLRELGYALDLTKCGNCGRSDKLNYLSPRTGRAVCDECAAPYLDRIYRLPLTLEITEKFLEKIDGVRELPLARKII